MRLEGWVAVIVSLRNNFFLTEGEKHCDESSHLTSRGHAHHGNSKYSPSFQLDRDLIASLDGSLHIVALRLEYPTALFISGAQLVSPADTSLRCNPVWKFLDDNIGAIEFSNLLKRVH